MAAHYELPARHFQATGQNIRCALFSPRSRSPTVGKKKKREKQSNSATRENRKPDVGFRALPPTGHQTRRSIGSEISHPLTTGPWSRAAVSICSLALFDSLRSLTTSSPSRSSNAWRTKKKKQLCRGSTAAAGGARSGQSARAGH